MDIKSWNKIINNHYNNKKLVFYEKHHLTMTLEKDQHKYDYNYVIEQHQQNSSNVQMD